MKKNLFTKIVVSVLSLALLVGAIVGITVSADESSEPEIIAQNIVYGDRVSIAYAVKADISDAISGAVGVSYYWSDETAEDVKKAILLDTTVSTNLYEGKYPVFVTEGVSAKDLDKVAFAAVQVGDTAPEEFTHSYSVVQYLYARLYRDGFVAKSEADGLDYERKFLYENLLAYGASAQSVLINGKAESDADKVTLITDYTYAYTYTEGVTINGGKAVIGSGSVEVTLVYVGDGSLAGWILTDRDGNETEVESSEFTVNGVALITPKFGVHTCADEDSDHLCDVCGETVSECKNENNDHLCDVCGKTVSPCVDTAVVDGRCDVCGLYTFEYNVTTGVNLYTFSSTGNANPTNQTSITADSSYVNASWYYGVLGSIATDPAGAANKALKLVINNGNQNSNTSGASTYPSQIQIYASDRAENGKIHVLEYDFYVERLNKEASRNFLILYAYDAAGNSSMLQNGGPDVSTNGHSKGILQVTGDTAVKNAFQMGVGSTQSESSGYALFDSHTWYRFRFVFDEANGSITTYVSFDKGENWYVAAKEATTTSLKAGNANFGTVDHLAFGFNTYGHGEIFYVDNVSYKVMTEAPTAHSQSGIDSVEALYR